MKAVLLFAALCILIESHLVVWSLSHHQIMHNAIYEYTLWLTGPHSLPSQTNSPILIPSNSVAAWSQRPTPVLPAYSELCTPSDLLLMPLVVPFTHSGGVESENGSISSNIPILFGTMTISLITLGYLWDRHLRGLTPDLRRFEISLLHLDLTLLILLPLPAVIAVSTRFYLLSSGSALPIVSTPMLLAIGALSLTLYPLVYLHLRWRRSTRFAGANAEPMHCNHCGYPLDEFTRCPECGTDRGSDSKGRLSRGRRRVLMFGYTAVPTILVAPFWLSWIDMGFKWFWSAI